MSSREPNGSPWPDPASDAWEREVQERARHFIYPPTPDLVRSQQLQAAISNASFPTGRAVVLRRLAWSLAVLLLVAAALATVEPVRAWVTEVLQLGAVRIFIQPPDHNAPLPVPTSTKSPAATATPTPLDWMGETTLSKASAQLPFTIYLPSWPPDLGAPDLVYVQDLAGPALLSVWMDPSQEGSVRLSLHALASDAVVYKFDPVAITRTQVDEREALWTDGPYLVRVGKGDTAPRRLVTGHVLIWSNGTVTYRLETDLSLEEAVRVAESLRPWEKTE